MNLQESLRGPSQEIKNNNKQALFPPKGDANANEIQPENEGLTGDVGTLPPLVSQSEEQDKMIMWETDSPSEDLDLEEFEMLECQELEAFLVEEKRSYSCKRQGGTRVMKGPPLDKPPPSSGTSDKSKMTKDTDNGQSIGHDRVTGPEGQGPEAAISCSQGGYGQARAQLRSENNIFVSCLSSVPRLRSSLGSALDNAGQANFWHIPSSPLGITSEDLAVATSDKGGRDVDLNRNSTALPQELHSQAQPEQGASHRGLSNGSGKNQGNPREEGRSCQQPAILMKESEKNGSGHAKKQGNGVYTELQKDFTARISPCEKRPLCPENSQGQTSAQHAAEAKSKCWTRPSVEAVCETDHNMSVRASQSNPLSNTGSEATPNPSVVKEPKILLKQGSVERYRNRSASPSSLERRTQLTRRPSGGSPTRPTTPVSPKGSGSPQKRPSMYMARTAKAWTSQKEIEGDLRACGQTCVSSGIPKPLLQHLSRAAERVEHESKSERSPPPKCPPKPKNVRPKIITYIRRSPQIKPQVSSGQYEASTLPTRLPAYTSPPTTKEPKPGVDPKAAPVLSASNLLYDKYRQEMQRARLLSSGLAVSGIKPPSHTVPHKLTGKSDGFCGELAEKYQVPRGGTSLGGPGRGDPLASHFGPDTTTGVFQPPRALRPQLGVGAVNRQPFSKNRMFLASQRASPAPSQPVQAVSPSTHSYLESSGDQKKPAPMPAPKSFLPKPGQSGLRPPGYSRLPAARLAAFGFVRSGSVSSVSSNQSNDSTRSDPCRPMYRPSSMNDDPPTHRVTAEAVRAPSRCSPQPPGAPAPTRRSLVLPARSSPVASRKEMQKDVEVVRPVVSSPKKCAVVPPKPQSPVHARQKPVAAVRSGVGGGLPGVREVERMMVQRLRDRCEQQAKLLLRLQAELRRASLGLEVFIISTQHFSSKSEASAMKERELSVELAKIKEEVASSAARWERLQREKEALEQGFEQELQELQVLQEAELGALEGQLRARHRAETDQLQAQHREEMDRLHTLQQEQIDELTISHEAAMEEIQDAHRMTVAKLEEDHASIVQELRQAHEDQRERLEEDFELLRVSLQGQVDTLTVQNNNLRERANRFEEALRKSADEQIGDALAPYQHIQDDLQNLKEVLEMKNQQIHEQENKISELQKMAKKNVFLEERVQVLQQQNEDLRARIELNLSLSRQLSEENANLQEHVEKESNEKKRLSRNNEELIWRLQTPSSSPLHRASPGPASPSHLQQASPGPASPSHLQRASPGPASPSHLQPFPQ